MSRHTADENPEPPPAECTAEEALAELKRRGREMSEAERQRYIRRAMQMVDSTALADRLLARVPSLADPPTDPRRRD